LGLEANQPLQSHCTLMRCCCCRNQAVHAATAAPPRHMMWAPSKGPMPRGHTRPGKPLPADVEEVLWQSAVMMLLLTSCSCADDLRVGKGATTKVDLLKLAIS
jgi:hypothetical protein